MRGTLPPGGCPEDPSPESRPVTIAEREHHVRDNAVGMAHRVNITRATRPRADSGDVPLVHVDFSHPYEGPLRKALLQAAAAHSIGIVDGGCIGVFQGPRLESAAEIERARRDGCNMAGMTSLPEAGLARELGLDYAGIAVVSNWGAGVSDELISEDDIAETLTEPMSRVRALLRALLETLSLTEQ